MMACHALECVVIIPLHHCIGNIFSALLISSLLPYGFEFAMMACSFLMFTGGIIAFLSLPEHPDTVGKSTYTIITSHQW